LDNTVTVNHPLAHHVPVVITVQMVQVQLSHQYPVHLVSTVLLEVENVSRVLHVSKHDILY